MPSVTGRWSNGMSQSCFWSDKLNPWKWNCQNSFTRIFVCLLIAASAIPGGYYCAPNFLQFKEFELYWGAVLFLDLYSHFRDFWSQIGVVILVTPKQEVERKSQWFCGVKFYYSNFKVEWENGVWTKIRFLASDFLFTCSNFTLIFTVFSIFWIGFFLNGFPNSFIVHSRPFFVWTKLPFLASDFLFTCGNLALIFCFFYFFNLI